MIAAVLEQLAELVNADAGLVRRGRYHSTTFLVETGATAWLVSVHEGRVTRVERGPFLLRAWSIAVRAPVDDWRRVCDAVPAGGWLGLFALAKGRGATGGRDLLPVL